MCANKPFLTMLLLGLFSVAGLMGCRGQMSREPPIHPNPNMDVQDKYKSFKRSSFFADGRTMRTPPANTIPRGFLRDDTKMWEGKDEDGTYTSGVPFAITMADMERGRSRYNIYCAPCHDKGGYGKGTVAKRSNGMLNPTNFQLPGTMCTSADAATTKKEKILSESVVDELGQQVVSEEQMERIAKLDKVIAGDTGCGEGYDCIAGVANQPDQCVRRLGWIFHVISNGSTSGLMGGYRHQIPEAKDRWAVAAYIRALQKSQNANRGHVVRYAPKQVQEVDAEFVRRNGGAN